MKQLIEYINEVKFGANKKQEDYKAIDLGLSVKWATCNIGAKKPTDYGFYFQWGNSKKYIEKDEVNKADFLNYNTTSGKQYKFNEILDPDDDAANVIMGKGWRMPTMDDFNELALNTHISFVDDGDNCYMKFTSMKDNSKSLIIPTAGYILKHGLKGEDKCTLLWTSKKGPDKNGAGSFELFCNYADDYSFPDFLVDTYMPIRAVKK